MGDKKLILGLDVSTATIGITLMMLDGDEKKIIKITSITPKIDKNIKGMEALFLKKKIFEDEFLSQYINTPITDCIIEEPLVRSNNIVSVMALIRFNTLISLSIHDMLGIVPVYISSHDARQYSYPSLLAIRHIDKKGNKYPLSKIKKALKDCDLPLFGNYKFDIAKKEVMLNHVMDDYGDIEWLFNKKNELKKENFDACDSLICCLGQINMWKYGKIVPEITSVNITPEEIAYIVKIWDKTYEHKFQL